MIIVVRRLTAAPPLDMLSTCCLTLPKRQVGSHPIFQTKRLRLTGVKPLLVATQYGSSSARSSAEVLLTAVALGVGQ